MSGRRSIVALACLLGILAGCGDDGSGAGSDGAGTATGRIDSAPPDATVSITGGELFFRPKETTVAAGRILFELGNVGAEEHTLLIDGVANFKLKAYPGETIPAKAAVPLEPGEYLLYCDISGHKSAGMQATLTVK